MRAAVIENGVVVNVIVVPGEGFEIPGKIVVISDEAAIGDQYVDGKFIKPQPPA